MNAPDDKTERSLRQYFDDFDANYEADGPSPAAWERIEAQIKPAPNSQKSLRSEERRVGKECSS